jgi:CheY-like chemotaxis protein
MGFLERPDGLSEYDPTHAVFRDLMSYRVREVLLVSSLYDSYILEEDGQLSESLDAEFYQLNLATSPRITQVSTADEALAVLEKRPFDLVITMARLGGMDPRVFARLVKNDHPEIPVVLLADNHFEAHRLKELNQPPILDQVFVAIIKFIEDRRNVRRDTELAGVRTIILIENSVRFYSSYLPLLYTELTKQTEALMADGVNARQRLRRMRARTKILLAETFEEGWELFQSYRAFTLGIISDARFPRGGENDPEAGIEFVRRVKAEDPDMPALIQSTDEALAERAHELGAAFLHKRSPRLLEELRRFIQSSLGFGDFVFIDPESGSEVARVPDLAGMPTVLRSVPGESLRYHASRNHFSNWCMARTEFALAARIRPKKVSDFADTEELRAYLADAFSTLQSEARRGVVADFTPRGFEELAGFARIGSGSMGGKGRGLGFINSLLSRQDASVDPNVRVFVPPAAVVGADVFDEFLQSNDLWGLALSDATDATIEDAFLRATLPGWVEPDLRALVERTRAPLAVRSSSLLEDSYDQPFAGIYKTFGGFTPRLPASPAPATTTLCSGSRPRRGWPRWRSVLARPSSRGVRRYGSRPARRAACRSSPRPLGTSRPRSASSTLSSSTAGTRFPHPITQTRFASWVWRRLRGTARSHLWARSTRGTTTRSTTGSRGRGSGLSRSRPSSKRGCSRCRPSSPGFSPSASER